jgi:hypothetical protein
MNSTHSYFSQMEDPRIERCKLHSMGRIFRIVKERYRCHKLFFDDWAFEIACGLHNFRLTSRLTF